MNHAERIARMRDEGVLDEAQAARLLGSLTAADPAEVTGRRGVPVRLILVTLTTIVAIALLFVLPGSPPPVPQDVAATLNQPGGVATMNRNLTAIVGLVLLLVIPFLILVVTYNGLVNREEAVVSSWSDVESTYQRRADLVPRLVESVSRFLRHEQETLTAVTRRRGDALRHAVDTLVERQAANAAALTAIGATPPEDPAALADLAARDAGLREAIGGFTAVVEDYPELRSGDQFLSLQAQLEGTENRINVARLRFNEAVETYNASLRRVPGSLVAGLGGFRRKAYFKATEGSDRAEPLGLE